MTGKRKPVFRNEAQNNTQNERNLTVNEQVIKRYLSISKRCKGKAERQNGKETATDCFLI